MNDSRKLYISKKRFTYARKKRHLKITEIANSINVPYETLRQCIRYQKIMPDHLDAIAQFMNVSPDYLKGMDTGKNPQTYFIENVVIKGKTSLEKFKSLMPITDPEGNVIPSYYMYQNDIYKQEKRELLYGYLSKVIVGCSKEFFDSHYIEIAGMLAPAINEISRIAFESQYRKEK